MSDENVQFPYDNFCIGPRVSTFCSIDVTNGADQAVLRTRNNSGSPIGTQFDLDSNIDYDIMSLEYTGPRNLNASEIQNGLPFFTLERIDSTECFIKRWHIDIESNIT